MKLTFPPAILLAQCESQLDKMQRVLTLLKEQYEDEIREVIETQPYRYGFLWMKSRPLTRKEAIRELSRDAEWGFAWSDYKWDLANTNVARFARLVKAFKLQKEPVTISEEDFAFIFADLSQFE